MEEEDLFSDKYSQSNVESSAYILEPQPTKNALDGHFDDNQIENVHPEARYRNVTWSRVFAEIGSRKLVVCFSMRDSTMPNNSLNNSSDIRKKFLYFAGSSAASS